MNYIIITGTSRGLGEAFAKKLISADNHLFCISRTRNNDLIKLAAENKVKLDYYEFDLSNLEEIEGLIKDIFSKIDQTNVESLYLFNNAGVLTPIKPIDKSESKEIINNISVNLIAPMILTSSFISLSNKLAAAKKIINISSGAGKKPYYSWSNYCTAKAGIDMFTQTVGLEQTGKANPAKIISIAPGVVETEMQKELRATDKTLFPQLDRFISLKEEGKLLPPDYVAEKIIDIVFNNDFDQGGIVDIRDF